MAARLALVFVLITPCNSLSVNRHGSIAGQPETAEEESGVAALPEEISLMNEMALQKDGPQCHSRESKRRLAMLISGRESRLLLFSKIKNVLVPLAAEGVSVDVYVDVVGESQGIGKQWTTVKRERKSTDLAAMQEAVENYFQMRCGSLSLMNVREEQELIDLPPNASIPFQYGEVIGANVLRRYSSFQFLMGKIREREIHQNFKYDSVLLTRDDDDWVGSFKLAEVTKNATDVSNAMFTKQCKGFGGSGYNDQTLLFGRHAADKILGNIFPYVMDHLGQMPLYAEHFFKQFADEIAGVEVHELSFHHVPAAVATYFKPYVGGGRPRLCHKKRYLCPSEQEGFVLHPCVGPERHN